MLRYALRSHLAGIIGYSAFFGGYAVIEVGTFQRLNQGSAQTGAVFQIVSAQMSYMDRPVADLNLLGGYIEWFLLGFFPLFFGLWAAVAGTGALRGEDERGLIEHWLAAGVRPAQLVFTRLAGFVLALLLVMAAVVLIGGGLAALTGQSLTVRGLLLQSLAEAAPAPALFAGAMVFGRLLPTRRNALGVFGIVLVAMYFVNGFSRTVDWLKPWAWLTPFAYADHSDALLPGGGLNLLDFAVPLVAAVLLAGLAAWMLGARDLGSAFVRLGGENRPPVRGVRRTGWAAIPTLVALWDQRLGLSVWMLGIFAYALSTVGLTKGFVHGTELAAGSLGGLQMKVAFGLDGADPAAGFIGLEWFRVACLILAAYAIVQVARWAAEDAEGRLEMMLAAGLPRWRVIVDRGLTLIAAGLLLATANLAAVWLGTRAAGIDLRVDRLLLASALLLPVLAAFGAAGAALAAWRPRVATYALGAVVVLGYFVPLMAVPIFNSPTPPDWFLDLSVFRLYGNPLNEGVFWNGLYLQVGILAAGFAVAIAAMRRREVGR
ncbi:MAG TPA: ABC transporter permease subunit [Candidatus Dormibacteraeota bacterium]